MHVLELPPNMGISPIFNVEDLMIFRGPTTSPDDHQFPVPIDPLATKADPPQVLGPYEHSQFEPDLPSPPTPPLSQHKEIVEDILDETLVSTKHGGVQKYLVK